MNVMFMTPRARLCMFAAAVFLGIALPEVRANIDSSFDEAGSTSSLNAYSDVNSQTSPVIEISGSSAVPQSITPVAAVYSDATRQASATSDASSVPPPPSGPPSPLLTKIKISGPTNVVEKSSGEYFCVGIYSDTSTQILTPTWAEDSDHASISSSGVLSAGDVSADESLTVTASLNGLSATCAVTISHVPVVLSGLTITGPTSVNEESSTQYLCVAHYSDGSTLTVTPQWSENSPAASVSDAGVFLAGNVTANQSVTLTATFGGLSDTHAITVKYVAPVLTGLTILGPEQIDEESSASFVCMASYSDGSSVVVSPSWSVSSGAATVSSSGVLLAGNLTADGSAVLVASFGGFSDSCSVSIKYVAPVLTGIAISGPDVVNEESSSRFVCTAVYSDGSSAVVVPEWSVSAAEVAVIGSDGMLQTGDVSVDEEITLSAAFGGMTGELALTVRVATTQIIYPLSNFSGKTVRADLWDAMNRELVPLGVLTSPEQLIIENLNPGQWYWLIIEERNDASGTWSSVQENWINM